MDASMNRDSEIINNNQIDKKIVKEFLLDINCLDALKPWISKINIFDILKVSRTEIRHSNMLSWLLDANENHGMDDLLIRSIIQSIVKNNQDYFESKNISVLELLTIDYSNFIVIREWNYIDILLLSHEDKLVICIENKIGIGEHDNQLERYVKKVESTYPKKDGYDALYIYLTPNNDLPSDINNWIPFSYVEVLDILNDRIEKENIEPRVKLIIENYMEILRRFVVKDKELEEICINIYKKHRQALDLIFDNKPDFGNIVADIVREYLANKASESENIIFNPDFSTKTIQRFSTETFNKIFPSIPDVKGFWGNGINYFWEIKNYYSVGKLNLKFVMCNYDLQNGGKTAKLAKLLNKGLKENWQWKTFESFNTIIVNQNQTDEFFEGDYEDIKKVIFSKLDKAMEKVSSFESKVKKLWTMN